MTAAAAPSTRPLRGAIELLAISAGLGVPLGALAYLIRDRMHPTPKIPSPQSFSELPLVAEKTAGLFSPIRRALQGVAGRVDDIEDPLLKYGLPGVGAATGFGTGYATLGASTSLNEAADLDKQLAEREETFNKLLLAEQMQAAGVKAADVLDNALDTIFEAVFEKDSAAKAPNPMSAGESLKMLAKDPMFPIMMALTGAYVGLTSGWSNTVATDKNRAVEEALRNSLENRLAGNPEGPRAPMVIKFRTDRLGATPIGVPGTSSSYKRDVLDRL